MISLIPIVASIVLGIALALLIWTLTTNSLSRLANSGLEPLERERREILRQSRPFYGTFEKLIQELRPFVSDIFGEPQLLASRRLSFSQKPIDDLNRMNFWL